MASRSWQHNGRAGVRRRNLVGLEVGDLTVIGRWFADMGLSMFVWARGASARRRPSERANALVWMQARNAEAATSAGFP
jgi:hypothetical protein